MARFILINVGEDIVDKFTAPDLPAARAYAANWCIAHRMTVRLAAVLRKISPQITPEQVTADDQPD